MGLRRGQPGQRGQGFGGLHGVARSATNLLHWAQDFSQSAWDPEGSGPPSNPAATATTSDVLAPDGTSTASKLVFGATTSGEFCRFAQFGVNVSAATVYALSIYARCLTGTQVFFIGIDGASAGPNAGFTLALTASWQRFGFLWTATGTNTIVPYVGSDARSDHGNDPMAAQTVYVWGAQFQADKLTKYIPTTTGPVTQTWKQWR